MRVVLLTSESRFQRRLANCIAQIPGVHLAGIVQEARPSRANLGWMLQSLRARPALLADRLAYRLLFGWVERDITRAAVSLFGDGVRLDDWPEVPVDVPSVNLPITQEVLRKMEPDLVVVSGTRIIKPLLVEALHGTRFLNLHTGLSPYYRGGPNCTMWALSHARPEFVGSTVHWLDAGIDTGPILMTRRSWPDSGASLGTWVCECIRTGHDLIVETLAGLRNGRTIAGIDQDHTLGRTFYSWEWNVVHLTRAIAYLRLLRHGPSWPVGQAPEVYNAFESVETDKLRA